MVELRKRKVEATPAASAPIKKSKPAAATKPKAKAEPKAATATSSAAPKSKVPSSGDTIDVEKLFPSTVVLSDGQETTVKKLLELSVSGVILFTYPKANTPGCTVQACAFRDANNDLSSLGYGVYGLSRDSVKANNSFKEKYGMPFTLICDQQGTLIKGLGFSKEGNKTVRGVIVVTKDGKVLEKFTGGPAATLEAVWPVVKAAEN